VSFLTDSNKKGREKVKKIGIFIAMVGVLAMSVTPVLAADVDVYAEGAYEEDSLDLYIYADINISNVLSYGVKLTYEPSELNVVSVEKVVPDSDPAPYTTNYNLWYLGDGANKCNPDPDTTTYENAVVIIGGKLDPSQPTGGLSNLQRIFLGKVKFQSADGGPITPNPTLSLGYPGQGATDTDPYKAFANFVQYIGGNPPGLTLDDSAVDFRLINVTTPPLDVAERGDANADGSITGADRGAVKYFMVNGGIPHAWMDCNKDGSITGADRGCIKYKMTH
jgi:hypothetical protein